MLLLKRRLDDAPKRLGFFLIALGVSSVAVGGPYRVVIQHKNASHPPHVRYQHGALEECAKLHAGESRGRL